MLSLTVKPNPSCLILQWLDTRICCRVLPITGRVHSVVCGSVLNVPRSLQVGRRLPLWTLSCASPGVEKSVIRNPKRVGAIRLIQVPPAKNILPIQKRYRTQSEPREGVHTSWIPMPRHVTAASPWVAHVVGRNCPTI